VEKKEEICERRTPEVGCDVVAFCTCGTTVLPLACQTKVVGTLTTDMIVAEMVVESLWVCEGKSAILPETLVGLSWLVGLTGGRVRGLFLVRRRGRESLGHCGWLKKSDNSGDLYDTYP
jgi:hypothetical protein